jgi:hypothetical protein
MKALVCGCDLHMYKIGPSHGENGRIKVVLKVAA